MWGLTLMELTIHAYMPWKVLQKEGEGFWSFQKEKALSAQSSGYCCLNTQDNAQTNTDKKGLDCEKSEE